MLPTSRKLCMITKMYNRKSLLHIRSSIFAVAFSFLEFLCNPQSPTHGENLTKIDESHVLSLLSDLLRISIHKPIAANSSPYKQLEFEVVDKFLHPADKFHGVFLQKLRGETEIHRVAVELDIDVFAGVVNIGYLSGESMVVFFNWAIKLPKNVITYNVILKALGRSKFFVRMVETLNEMKVIGTLPNSETLHILMDSYIRACGISKAIVVFKELENYGLKCEKETLNVALRCLCLRLHLGMARSLLKKMREKV